MNYLNRQIVNWNLCTIVLDKLSLVQHTKNPIKERIYNQMTHQILEQINFPSVGDVNLVVDRSKNDLGIKEFNNYLNSNLSLCLNLETKLYISHDNSEKHKVIQAVDMFCYGIARKYELKDESWYSLFKNKLRVECEFKP